MISLVLFDLALNITYIYLDNRSNTPPIGDETLTLAVNAESQRIIRF